MKKLCIILLLIICKPLYGEEASVTQKRSRLDIELLNMFILRNDTDFDRTEPFYSKYGQEMGIAGTFFNPMFTIIPNDSMRFYWEAEIGLDIWGRNNPDIGLDEQNSQYAIGLKQREIYGEVNSKGYYLKAGFQRVMDISTLFINHWIGALRVGYLREDFGITLSGGEYPDQTYKGWDLSSSNFMTDVYLISADGYYYLMGGMKLSAGVYFVDDMHLIQRRRQITAIEGGISFDQREFHLSIAGVYLNGYRQLGGADVKNTGISAFGAMARTSYDYKNSLKIEATFSYMSPDDRYEGNDSGAFLFSSRRSGPSLILSENDMRPIGDNIDKRIGAYDGVFYEMKAGLIGFDIGIYYTYDFLRIGPISGVLLTANEENSMGSKFVGWENDLLMEVTLFDSLFSFQLISGILIPGEAGAAFINTINKVDYTDSSGKKISVTEPVYYIQSGILMKY